MPISERLRDSLADRYRLERELGQGGMATVYLAEDLKHKRRVAVKVLKPELAAVLGAERFVQEITTTAALQHPHILPLFDSGEADGFLYYVMPFIDGETLRAKLDRETQLGVDEAVKLASEVADALHYAHEQGVIHRDIKPENILLTNGRPMVADFGIALAVSAAAGGRMTETGLSLGTPHYMSPEQATAEKEITRRSDVYSLASVLFEMLTGQPPHLGGSAQQIIMKIITEQPVQVTALRKSVPPHVAAAVAKALEKLPADRFETAAKFAHALNDPGFATRAGSLAFAAGAGGVPARWRTTALALGGIAALALGAALWLGLGARGASQMLGGPVQFDVQLPEGVELSQAGTAIHAAVSPDGNTVAFLASDGATRRIYLRHLGDSEVRPVAGTESASLMFFSPDGQSLGFVASGRLSRVGLADGIITTISVLSGAGLGGAAWGANNVIVVSNGASSALWRVPATGGEATVFLAPDTARGDVGFALPHFLPDGKSLVFSINRGRGVFPIAVGTLEGELTELGVSGLRAQYVAASGHLLFSDGGGRLLGARFDPDRQRILGAPAMLLEGVQENLATIGVWAASPTGTVVVDRGTTQSRLALVDREGTAQPLSDDARSFRLPRVSPDGQRILVQVTASGQEGLWLHDRRTGTLTRFTPPGRYSDGIWSRDGTRIAFSGDGADQSADIFWQSADGSGSAVPLLQAPGNQWPWTWTPDGRTLLYDEIVANRATRVMAVTIDSAAPRPSAVLESAAHLFRTPTLSPDGRWLAYTSNESGRIEVYVRPFPGSGGKQQVSLSGGDQPVWSRDGSELFYRDDRNLISASLRFDGAVSVTARTALFEDRFERSNATNYDALPNGRGFVMLEPQSGTRRLSVLVNWGTQLRARIGGEEQ